LYRQLAIDDAIVDTSGDYDLLSKSASSLNQLYTISSGIEDRNTLITMSLLFSSGDVSSGDTQLEMVKQVVVRNVP
jgi:hypothetical protein